MGVGTALALMVLVVITTARNVPVLRSPTRDPDIHIRHGTFKMPTPSGALSWQPKNTSANNAAHAMGVFILQGLLVLAMLFLLWIVIALVVSWVRRLRRHHRARLQGPLPDVDDAVLAAVGEAATRQQQLIREGAPANAIVACWVDLERAVATAGVERRPSETSAELTIRLLDALDVDRRALRTLGALYREARFSSHPVGEHQRELAVDALDALHRSLPKIPQDHV